MVCLRIFRHRLARLIVQKISDSPSSLKASNSVAVLNTNDDDVEGMAVGLKTTTKENTIVPQELPKEHLVVLAEVWEKTVRDNPAVVEQFGEFSGEILRRMLGIQLDLHEVTPHMIVDAALQNTVPNQMTALSAPQSIQQRSERLMAQVVDVDTDDEGEENISQMIAYPKARLVRSMRRCDKKLLPILDEWVVVDVAITRFEIVYFDAAEADSSICDNAILAGTRRDLTSTKGGKGLRLGDVAKGQRVVGRMLLRDVSTVSVERHSPGLLPIESPAVEVTGAEFWVKNRHDLPDLASHISRAQQWDSEAQDLLQVSESTGQILCLRFYSDLEDAKTRHDVVETETSSLHKNNSLSWALTITRFCGPDQLKQPLPNFGQDNEAELRDLLHLNNHTDGSSKEKRHDYLRRQRSSSPRRIFHRSGSLLFSQNDTAARGHSGRGKEWSHRSAPRRQFHRSSSLHHESPVLDRPRNPDSVSIEKSKMKRFASSADLYDLEKGEK